jgi:homocitrate synthase
MCPHANGNHVPTDASEMVAVPLTNGSNGVTNGKRGTTRSNGFSNYLEQRRTNPYAPRAADFLSNVSNFNIIESTLRGLTFHNASITI